MTSRIDRRLAVAPMMDWTDPACRYFLRLLSRHTLLYTEMVPAAAIWHGGKSEQFLAFDSSEHPVAVQFGGSEPAQLAFCAEEAQRYGYDEVNLNVGCPSDRVQSGRFGACLMAEPELVADCVEAMQRACNLPVTVKTRIGIDYQDDPETLARFVDTVAERGCRTFIIHARKAWLKGLSPKENREKPPLNYERVHWLKARFPQLEIVINGGIEGLDAANGQLAALDGVMIGRAAYHNPYLLAGADSAVFGDDRPAPTRQEVLEGFIPYVERRLAEGQRLSRMSRHIIGLFQGEPGARAWRRHLSEAGARKDAGVEVIREAAGMLREPLALAS